MKLRNVFRILAGITLVVFVMLLYQKIQSWVSISVGDSNWTIIIVGLLLAIFVTAGFIGTKHIKKKFL